MSGTFYAPVASSLSHTHTFPPKSKTHGQFGPPPSEPAGEAKEKDNIFEEEGKEQAAAGPGAVVEASTDAEGKSVGRALGGAVLPPFLRESGFLLQGNRALEKFAFLGGTNIHLRGSYRP